MRKVAGTIFVMFALGLAASAQMPSWTDVRFNGGYSHITGNQGLNGFDVGAEVAVVHPATIAFDYDSGWNTSTLGLFQTTSVGLTSSKSHLQDWIVGPRIYLPGVFKNKEGKLPESWGSVRSLVPFIEAQFGESHLSSTLTSVSTGSMSASGTAFAWELGGGADVRLNPHWDFRAKLDLLRTHFADAGQSRARFFLGVAYSVRARKKR